MGHHPKTNIRIMEVPEEKGQKQWTKTSHIWRKKWYTNKRRYLEVGWTQKDPHQDTLQSNCQKPTTILKAARQNCFTTYKGASGKIISGFLSTNLAAEGCQITFKVLTKKTLSTENTISSQTVLQNEKEIKDIPR